MASNILTLNIKNKINKEEVFNMNIYLTHSTQFDYINKLYEPIKKAKALSMHHFFFPHDETDKFVKTKEIINDYDLVIADISLPSTGLGIELGWADDCHTPILCISEKDAKFSSSLKFITNNFITYDDTKDLIEKIDSYLKH